MALPQQPTQLHSGSVDEVNWGLKESDAFPGDIEVRVPNSDNFVTRAAHYTRNDGYDSRLLRVNTRLIWTLKSACDSRISTAITRCHPSQNSRYARFTGTGK